MAYAGETVRVISRITDYDDVPIDDDDGVTVVLRIYHDGTLFAGPFTMVWSPQRTYWYHDWDTEASGAAPGAYRTKVRADGGAKKAWGVSRLRLAQSPV